MCFETSSGLYLQILGAHSMIVILGPKGSAGRCPSKVAYNPRLMGPIPMSDEPADPTESVLLTLGKGARYSR